ncbi:CaiB/BaiF CoA transferase family protein [Psychrobacter fulvigenes]|uniref:CaiB/BaiF CoA transferase family protein n=1 Tax=Psychrobacter fulvigenes TaxID=533323 RepID=UPI00191A2AC1|nr:CaiB/BaiF CoA-transferase family protein [Psychrobacter fulvigenes]
MTDSIINSMADCLQGLRVVDLTRNLPGPFATRLLADLGADIIKIEPKNGDPARAFGELFAALNHGKATEKHDFRDPKGIAAIKAHIKDADVMLDSFRPGVLAGMGLGAKTLHALNPKLVMVSITGYGVTAKDANESAAIEGSAIDESTINHPRASHDWAHKAGHDINFMAMSGVLDQLKTANGEQAMLNVQFADLAGGSDTAVIALLAAVFAAQRTGKGRHIAVSMTHSLYQHLVMPKETGALVKSFSGQTPPPHLDFLGGLLPCYRLYRTLDNRYMAVGSLELKFWQGLCEALELPELKESHWQLGVMPNSPESLAAAKAVSDTFSSKPLAHWQQHFASIDVCVTPVLSLQEAKAHPLFAHQDQYYSTPGWQLVE